MKHSWIFLATHIILLLAPLTALLHAAEASPSPAKLNVLLIMADDLRDFGGAFTKEVVKTPNLDRLRARGTTFERAYVQYPVCNPSRCSMMTGLRAEQTGVVGNDVPLRQKMPDVVTLPQLCKDAGWQSHAFGKLYHLGGGRDVQARQRWMDTGRSWHTAQSYEATVAGRKLLEGRNVTGDALKWCAWGAADGTDDDQPDGQIAAATVAMIEELGDAPWFIGCGFMKPHDPFIAPKKYFDLYPPDSLSIWNDPTDATAVRKESVGFGAYGEAFAKFTNQDWRELFRAYLAGTSFMDAQLGRVLDALDKHKLWDKTIVIFVGDHGYHTGERQWWNKNTLFERSCRAPMIIAAPGMKGGQSTTSLVEFIDLYPTVADFCGLKMPHAAAGVSLRPVLADPAASIKDAAFTLVTRGAKLHGQSIRTARWRFTRWSDGKTELYDHDVDPEELRDVSASHADTIAHLTARIQKVPTLSALHAADAPAKRPNILFIAIDDQNDWIGHMGGHSLVKTPHIDRLAARGTTFLNAHCQAPLCNPSRASLLLSLRPSTTGIYGLAPAPRTLPQLRDRVSLPQHFAAQGYRTAATGKIYHGGTNAGGGGGAKAKNKRAGAGTPATHIAPEFEVTGAFGGVGTRPPKKLIPPTPQGDHPLVDWGVWPLDNDDTKKGDYQVATWTVEQIKSAPQGRPFFIAAGFFLPHVPCYATQKWFDLYPDDNSVLPKTLEGDRDDTPRFSWYLHWKQSAPRLKWVQENDQWRNLVRSYLASTSFVDAQVGRVLAGLEESGHADNTIVVLWSDHGWHLGEKGITGKCALWERSTRVPLIFAGPGVKAGQRCTQPAELLDIYPTLIELAGTPRRDGLEGISLVPQLRDAAARRERPAITSHNQGNHAIRSQRWRYIRYADGSEEFYDMQADPNEWHNLAAKPEHAAIIAQHKRWLPRTDVPPAPGSAQRILTYDKATDQAIWDGAAVKRSDPIPQ